MVETRLLRQFLVVAEELHFGRAALRLHMAQPPLSQAMLKLEERVGVLLFERTSRRVNLTSAGECFRERAKQILLALDDAVEEARRTAASSSSLVVSGVQFRGYDFLLAALRCVCDSRSRVNLRQGPTAGQIAWLNARSTDVAFLRGIEGLSPDFKYERVATEHLYAVVGAHHRFADLERISLAHLTHEQFVLTSQRLGPAYYDLLVHLCGIAGFTPSVRHEVEDMLTLVGLVEGGMGVSIVPASVVAHSDGVRFIPLEDDCANVPLFMAWQADTQNKLRDDFLAAVRKRKPTEQLMASAAPLDSPSVLQTHFDARPTSRAH